MTAQRVFKTSARLSNAFATFGCSRRNWITIERACDVTARFNLGPILTIWMETITAHRDLRRAARTSFIRQQPKEHPS